MSTAKERSLSHGKDKIYLSWDEYINYINILKNKIQESNINFNLIYGIARGGLIPATVISNQLDIQMVTTFQQLYDTCYNTPKKILIVDDIIDNGNTITNALANIGCIRPDVVEVIKTATIFKHEKASIIPDYFIAENKIWIQFPYEKD